MSQSKDSQHSDTELSRSIAISRIADPCKGANNPKLMPDLEDPVGIGHPSTWDRPEEELDSPKP